MTRTLTSLLVLLPIAVVVAWQLGFTEPRGVAVGVGYFVGATVSWWGIYYQRHVMTHYPERMSSVTAIDFCVKLVVVLVGAMSIRSIPEFAATCDWRTFLVTFATISVVVLTFGTLDAVRSLAPSATPTSDSAQS